MNCERRALRPLNGKLYLFILILLAFTWSNANVADAAPRSFDLCWKNLPNEVAAFSPTVADGKVFVPLVNGDLAALDANTGEIAWRANLGGEITTAPQIDQNFLFVVSRTSGEQKQQTLLRALKIATGLTAWQIELPPAANVFLQTATDKIIVGLNTPNGTAQITAFNAQNGAPTWTRQQPLNLTAPLIVRQNRIYAASNHNLIELAIADGRETRRLTWPSLSINKLNVARDAIYVSDPDGSASAASETSGKVLWTARFGAGLQEILSTDDGVLFVSLDDFLYFHQSIKGKRVWRKRLTGRPNAAALLNDDQVFVSVAGDQNAAIIDLKKGRDVMQLPLGAENFVTAQPLFVNDALFVPTKNNLLSFTVANKNCAAAKAKSANSQ